MRAWIKQPVNTRICGQIAVAVVTGISLENAIKLVDKKRNGTTTKDLSRALRYLGYKCPNKCKKMPRPPLAIAQVHRPNFSGWHWVVVDGDKIFDGAWGTPDGKVHWKKMKWKITSYLPIEEP